MAAVGDMLVGSGQTPDAGALVETILTTPVVSALPVRLVLTDRVRRPSGLTKQLQHSVSSWLGSNTKIAAHRFAPAVPGLVMRRVPSGAPAVLALAK